MISFGIMQGRLTPSFGRGIQFFPFDNWKNEFNICAQLGLNEIEWIFDYPEHENNPLWTDDGVKEIIDIIESTGVNVRSVCFDYFMRRPFYKYDVSEREQVREENLEFIRKVLLAMNRMNANLLEIPMVDNSSVKNDEEKELVIGLLHDTLAIAKPLNIKVGCETDMPVGIFRDFLVSVHDDALVANYDSGNSSGLGYDHFDEIHSLNELIANVHIKDRVLNGTTVELGTGSADFDKVFSSLKDIGYQSSILLQAARTTDGDEENNIRNQIKFVKSYCSKYGLV